MSHHEPTMFEYDPHSLARNEQLERLLRDPDLGAGNFVHKLIEAELDRAGSITLEAALPLGAHAALEQLGWRELARESDRIAAWYASGGVEAKDPVALWFDDCGHYLFHYVALTSIGALPVHIHGSLDAQLAFQFLARVGATRIMTDTSREAVMRRELVASQSRIPLYNVDARAWLTEDFPVPPRFRHQPDDPVLIGHSSGTTGTPKAVRFNHEGFFYGVKRELHKQVGQRVLSALPHAHASALSILMTACLRGATIQLQTQKQPLQLVAAIESFRPDLFVSFPKLYVDLCRLDLESHDLSSIAYWLSTGDANHESHIRRLMQHGSHVRKDGTRAAGSLFIDNLGASELGFAAFRNVHRPGDEDARYARRIGRPYDWVDAAVLDLHGDRTPPFVVGRLGVRAPSVTAGYWNDSVLTEKNKLAGYWLTGDLAYCDQDGVFFHVDRGSDVITTEPGVLYSCQAEELVLKHFPEVFDCSIAAARQADGTQIAVMTAEIALAADGGSLKSRIDQLFAANGLPALGQLHFDHASTDVGVTGKKLKRVMRDRFAAHD